MLEVVKAYQAPSIPPVLVPIDFSDCSRAALTYAARLLDGTRTPLLMLHVIHDSAAHPGIYRDHHPTHSASSITDIAGEMVGEMLEELCSQSPGLKALEPARLRLVRGLPGQRIIEIAELERAVMIIMGTHGRNGIAHLLQGSVAEYVLNHARIPVTTVKEDVMEPEHLNVDGLISTSLSGGI